MDMIGMIYQGLVREQGEARTGSVLIWNSAEFEVGFLSIQPRRAICLWDMIQVSADSIFRPMALIQIAALKINAQAGLPDMEISTEEKQQLLDCLEYMEKAMRSLELEAPVSHMEGLLRQLRMEGPCYSKAIEMPVINFIRETINSLKKPTLAFIDGKKAEFFEKDNLFGDLVAASFASANQDIKDAGNCLAADLNTAAVYHLMCVVEHGLQALAKYLKVSKTMRKVPVGNATWDGIISALKAKVETHVPMRNSKRKKEREFLSELLADARAFEHLWRNKVMHARVRYSASEAEIALVHVRRFMQALAARVPE